MSARVARSRRDRYVARVNYRHGLRVKRGSFVQSDADYVVLRLNVADSVYRHFGKPEQPMNSDPSRLFRRAVRADPHRGHAPAGLVGAAARVAGAGPPVTTRERRSTSQS